MGSSSVRLQVIDAGPGAAPLPAFAEKWLIRLAEHAAGDGTIRKSGENALVAALDEAVAEAARQGAVELLAFATAALRRAPNGDAIIDRVKSCVGVHLQVLDGEDEARFTFLAVRRWLGWRAGPLLVLDIGGGSLEIARGRDEHPELAVSLPLGAGTLSREFLRHDPPTPEEMSALRRHASSSIREISDRLLWEGPAAVTVGTSSTFRHLARLTGAAPGRDGPFVPRRLRRARLRKVVRDLAAFSAVERCELPGVSPGRAGQIVAGGVVAHAVMKALTIDTLHISPWALREGILLQRLDSLTNSDQLHASGLVSAGTQHLRRDGARPDVRTPEEVDRRSARAVRLPSFSA
ncbi:MAG: hypothetical protein J2P57_05910 [Acidimicrobiaceae bacterium]|nr:hypothetical protein [Acidimicrobiaceae bacterium]